MKRRTYLKAIRKFCVECMGDNYYLVKECPSINCKFYLYRFGKNPDVKPKITPLKSIRLYCLECVGTSDEVKNCTDTKCGVYYFRFGRNPKLKGKGNPTSLLNYRKNADTINDPAIRFNESTQTNTKPLTGADRCLNRL